MLLGRVYRRQDGGKPLVLCSKLSELKLKIRDTHTLKSVTVLSRLFFVFFTTVQAVAKETQKGDTEETKEKAGHRFLQLLSYATL